MMFSFGTILKNVLNFPKDMQYQVISDTHSHHDIRHFSHTFMRFEKISKNLKFDNFKIYTHQCPKEFNII